MSRQLLQQALDALETILSSKPVRDLDETICAIRAHLAAPQPEPWQGAEEWERLAWNLCAEENGEDACNELIWEGGAIKEPWGERWLKYEDEAKRMIALVRKHVAAPPAAPAPAVLRPAVWGTPNKVGGAPSAAPAVPDYQWKSAIDDELVCCHIGTTDSFPDAKAALKNLIDWHVSVALDPAVSSDAQALIERGRSAAPAVPLTDEQMWQLWNAQGDDAMDQTAAIKFARAIEQAHGIGGGK